MLEILLVQNSTFKCISESYDAMPTALAKAF